MASGGGLRHAVRGRGAQPRHQATDRPLAKVANAVAVMLVEGISDQIALETAAVGVAVCTRRNRSTGNPSTPTSSGFSAGLDASLDHRLHNPQERGGKQLLRQ